MRLIDADALKEELGIAEDCDDCERLGAHGCVNSTWAIVCDRIESAPAIDAVSCWIPCEERLPESDGEYLCCYGKHIHIGQMIDGHFRHYGECADHLITAWMPLPAPYEGGGKDDDRTDF